MNKNEDVMRKTTGYRGFTLIELMVVVAIVAILSTVAVPWYGQYVQRGVRGEAISALQGILDAQERFYTDRMTYTANLTDLGLADPFITPRGDYQITARVCAAATPLTQCVELIATAINAQAEDGNLVVNTRGRQERILPDNSVVSW